MKTLIILFQLFLIKGSMKQVIQVQNGGEKKKYNYSEMKFKD